MQRRFSGHILLPLALAAILAGCGDGGDNGEGGKTPTPTPTPPPPKPTPDPRGTLNVDIQPNNFQDAKVIISGPSGVKSVTRDSSLKLNPGNYGVTVVGVRVPREIVDDVVGVVDASTVVIVSRQTKTVTADYSQTQAGAGSLWYPVRDKGGANGQIHGFDRDQLKANFNGPGSVTLTGIGIEPINTTFDAGGNLWVALFKDNAVIKYNAEQLAVPGGSMAPDVTISTDGNGSLNGPVGLAFDRNGNLWVGNFNPSGPGHDSLVRFTPQQLAQSGQPTPAVKLQGFVRPYGQAFDAAGNLWIGNNGAGNVLRFPPAQQKNGGMPDVTITKTFNGVLANPRAPAFNSDGDLWVSSAKTSQAAAYRFGSAGVATPVMTVNLKNAQGAAVPSPDGLAFDNEGNLWVAASDNSLYKYEASNLADGANVKPTVTIRGFGTSRGVLFSFYPPALDLPLLR